ncbi:hypothetical protein [Caudoviricetes sp.]|nr:hypothetical protein [Caudoviricetes sp.]
MAILTMARHRFYKNDGTPNSGGKVYSYVAGTTTPTPTYTSSDASTPNANPIILNSKGECDLWVTGQIKLNVLESDNTQVTGWPVDNIGSGVANNDATMRWAGTAAGTANALTITPSPAIGAYVVGQSFIFKAGASPNSAATTIAISGLSAIAVQVSGSACSGGEILAGKWYSIVLDSLTTCQLTPVAAAALAGSSSQVFFVGNPTSSTHAVPVYLIRNYINGLQLSTTGSSATMAIGAGVAMDSTNTLMMSFASVNGKTTSAWAVGVAGGLDTGTIANSTWYHFYLIRRPDTGVVDVVFSLNAASPALPANYTQYRYIGSGVTDGSAQWRKFNQAGDLFEWDVPDANNHLNASTSSTSALTAALPTPLGLVTEAILYGYVTDASATITCLISNPNITDSACTNTRLTAIVPSNNGYGTIATTVKTDTSSKVRVVANGSGSTTVSFSVFGYINKNRSSP